MTEMVAASGLSSCRYCVGRWEGSGRGTLSPVSRLAAILVVASRAPSRHACPMSICGATPRESRSQGPRKQGEACEAGSRDESIRILSALATSEAK